MASEIRVNSLTNRSGLSTVSITDTGAVFAGLVTATTFSGPLTGNITGNVTGNVTGNLTGNVTGTATTATALSGSPSIAVADITATGNVSIGGTLTYEDVTNIDSVGIITAQSDVLVGRNLSVTSGISTVKSLDYAAIDSTISDTAVDVFIYDTSKDSDGGAWRYRTQHTSWYNETLGTATRGSRKEFPAVAVIVAEASLVTIYDGDDPDLPLWISFPTTNATGVTALNGELCLSANASGGPAYHSLLRINFIADNAINHRNNGSATVQGYFVRTLSSTDLAFLDNGAVYWTGFTSEVPNIVNSTANDVAMTVLPNAPIDETTGLPVPTIAVATNGGVSVIRDHGPVYDITTTVGSNNEANHITFNEEKTKLSWLTRNGAIYALVTDIPDADITARQSDDVVISLHTSYVSGTGHDIKIINGSNYNDLIHSRDNILAFAAGGSNSGLQLVDYDYENLSGDNQGKVCQVTTSFNTGWQYGDIKSAFLSDTVTTQPSELITNGTFDSNIDGWSSFNSVLSHQTDAIRVADDGSWSKAYQSFTTVVGRQYQVKITIKTISANAAFAYAGAQNPAQLGGNDTTIFSSITSTGTYYGVFTATATTSYIEVTSDSTSYVEYSEISVKEAEQDRSVGRTGIQAFGTVTKSAVATGADLVSYGPFSTSNRLRQPYNSDLNFGTNDFSIILWMYNTGSTVHQTLVGRDSREFSVDILDDANHNRKFRIYSFDNGNSLQSFDSNDDPFPLNTWSHVCVNYTGGNTVAVYVNGVLNKSGTLNYDINDTSYGLNIGCRNTGGTYAHAADATKLALVRISGSAPSEEQIKKMYQDEKMLFQENAKATLHGTSNGVTALAFDDDTDLLHAGTGDGRSDFQGLRRINNTTTAVTTAITAQNEFIIEQ
jgi:hypothetical protein